jgi:hypothetical protein
MITKYNLGDNIKTDNFDGIVIMITITKRGIRYRAYGTRYYETYALARCQEDIWEDEIKGEKK